MFRRKRCSACSAARLASADVLIGKHREHAIAHQLQHIAAGIVDRIDGGLGIIVEKRNDFVGTDVFADRGRAAQVGKPQHGVDAFGHAARDPPAQNLFGRVTAEIDPAQRSRDVDLGGGFDRKPQHRHEIAQRRQTLRAEAVRAPRQPVGIDAVHLADGSGFTEPMHERHKMTVAFCGKLVDRREVERGAIGEIDPHFVVAVLQHVKEGRAPPVLRRIALPGRSIFEAVALVGLGVVPAKSAALENRVQRIDEDQAARQIEAFGAAALAEAAHEIVLGKPVRPWLTSQFISLRRGARSMSGPQLHTVACRIIWRHHERPIVDVLRRPK